MLRQYMKSRSRRRGSGQRGYLLFTQVIAARRIHRGMLLECGQQVTGLGRVGERHVTSTGYPPLIP